MFDWNHDGKQDWQDDYIFHEIIQTEVNNTGKGPADSHNAAPTSVSPGVMIGIIVLVLFVLKLMSI